MIKRCVYYLISVNNIVSQDNWKVFYHLVVISHSQPLQSVTMLLRFVCSSLRYSLLLALITVCCGRNFEKCKLARKLAANRFSDSEIRTTLCYGRLSEYNNRFMVTMQNESFYGLFAIHEPWCTSSIEDSPAVSKCNDYCKYMMDDHLINDINCLRKIYDGKGRWTNEFKLFYESNNLSNLKDCEKTIVDDCDMLYETNTNQIVSPLSQNECWVFFSLVKIIY